MTGGSVKWQAGFFRAGVRASDSVMRIVSGLSSFCVATFLSLSAHATAPGGQVTYDVESVSYQPPPTERRGGFAMGVSGSYGLGVYRGYPLSVDALNDPNGRQSTGASLATNTSLWLGGTPRDWLSAGLGLALLSANFNEARGVAAALVVHVEAFPLYSLGGTLENLGLGFDGGIGVATLFDPEDKEFEDPLAESGSLSTLGFSAFWEPIRFWQVSMGPTVSYIHGFSQTMNVNQFTIGWRSALYGVQPKKKREGS
jgi:hypothetical protein